MASKSQATIIFNHQTKEYQGRAYSSFTAVLKAKGKEYLIKLPCLDDSQDINTYVSDKTDKPFFYGNVFELDSNRTRKRKNEI